MEALLVHPCRKKPHPKSKLKPDTTFTLRYIKMRPDRIPASYPYLTPAVPDLYPNRGMCEHLPIPFFEFRGVGAPPPDVGGPGDVYIDTGDAALYAKAEEDWSRWCGPVSPDTLSHPHFADSAAPRFVAVDRGAGVRWVSDGSVRQHRAAERAKGNTDGDAQAGFVLAAQIIRECLAGVPAKQGSRSPRKKRRAARGAVPGRQTSAMRAGCMSTKRSMTGNETGAL
ncbi:hypothetical protein B0H17DRAFT_1068922, partial [Mycena rosella]